MSNYPRTQEIVDSTTDEGLKIELQNLLKTADESAEREKDSLENTFIKTDIVVDVSVVSETSTVAESLEHFKNVASVRNFGGVDGIDIDPKIAESFPNEQVSEKIKGPFGLWKIESKASILHGQVSDGCKKLGIHRPVDIINAIRIATVLVSAGVFDKKTDAGVIIYLKDPLDGVPQFLCVSRINGRSLNLYLFPVYEYRACLMAQMVLGAVI